MNCSKPLALWLRPVMLLAALLFTVGTVQSTTLHPFNEKKPQGAALRLSPPGAFFTMNPTTGCAPLLVDFFNASLPGAYTWDFGDSSPFSFVCTPTHIYTSPGTYTVTLTVVYLGTPYTHTETITVLPKPTPTISGDTDACIYQTKQYSTPYVSGHTYSWQVLGGSYTLNPTHDIINITWNTTGIGRIVVAQNGGNGCIGYDTLLVDIHPIPAPDLGCRDKRQQEPTGGSTGQPNEHDTINEDTTCICGNSIKLYAMPDNGNVYTWTVNNGTIVYLSSSGDTIKVRWNNSGFAFIKVVETSPWGCKDSDECLRRICPGPIANFSSNVACLNNPTTFTNLSIGNTQIISSNWYFGDGGSAIDNSTTLTHNYPGAGPYNATLVVTNENGCTDDTTIQVTLNPGTGPEIFCPSTVCAYSQAVYSTIYYPGATYTWSIPPGQGTFTTNAHGDTIRVQWGAGPTGTITLNVTGGPFTCYSSTITVPVFPANPVITGPAVACQNEYETYTAPMIPGTVYTWTVTGVPSNPSFTNVTNANNSISVNVGNRSSFKVHVHMKNDLVCCEADTFIDVIVKPRFSITGANSICQNTSTTYFSGGVPATWTIVGGTPAAATGTSVTVTWGNGPVGTILATPINPLPFCNTSSLITVTINPAPPLANISGPDLLCENSTAAYSVPNDPSISYSWNVIAGGTGSSLTNVLNATWGAAPPADTGIVRLIQTKNGCSSTTYYKVKLIDQVMPLITGDDTACVNDIKTYSIPSNPASIYEWTVIGGNLLSGAGTNSIQVQWGYSSPGKVHLRNTICNTASDFVVALYDTPTISVDTVLTCAPGPVTLVAHSCATCTYKWTQGMTVLSLTNTYSTSTPGTYTLTVTNPAGCSNTKTFIFSPIPHLPAPNASITASIMPNNPFCPRMWKLSAVNDPNYSYTWTQGFTVDHAVAVYDSVAGHVWNLTVTNQYGCTATNSFTIPPGGSCVPDTGSGGGPGCTPMAVPNFTYNPCDSVLFTNTSTGAVSYYWTFGDSTYSYQTNPYHSYQYLGTFPVTLWAYDVNHCVSSTTINVVINNILRAKFSDSVLTCNPLQVKFFGSLSTALSTAAITYSWNFGDFTTGTGVNPTHTYASPGTYTVTLTISSNGCTSVFTKTIVVKNFDANFTSCSFCTGQPTSFVDLSVSPNPIVDWQWSFGDGYTSTIQNPWHPYAAPGTYNVKLVITDSRGCKDSVTYPITISTFTAGPMTIVGDTTFCEGGYVILKAPFNPTYTYLWSDGTLNQVDTVRTSGMYSVIVISSSGCKDTIGPVKVTVNPVPYAIITGPDTTCEGSQIRLDAPIGFGYTYKWYLNGFYYTNTQSVFVTYPWQAGNYTLVVDNGFCKDSSAVKNVVVLSAPVPAILVSPSGYICQGTPAILTASGVGIVSYFWSTGATTPSITVTGSGSYTVTVLYSNGCSRSNTYNMNFSPLPDLSIIPKGCYTICDGQVVKVPGPKPVGSQSFQYYWYRNNVLVSTAYTYLLNSAGDYFVIVKDMITGCADTSDVFSVTVVPSPVAVITPLTPAILCIGTGGSVLLGANPGPYTYEWYQLGYPYVLSNASTYSATTAGTYILKVMVNKCCMSSDTIVIEETNCCFPPGTRYTPIPHNYQVNSDQVWDGKYFIEGKVYVNLNAVLDLTEVDLVFSDSGEIIFRGNSTIRANNSVLRPCLMRDKWVGLTFLQKSKGYIHTTLFKNATVAVNYKAQHNKSVRLTDNSFVNCNTAVYISKPNSYYDEGITGNTFTVDSTIIPFSNPATYIGIQIENTRFNELISQNEFRNSTKYDQYKRVYGIIAVGSSVTISENTFSNMFRSVDVSMSIENFSIENNNIEITKSRTPNDYQIRISRNDAPLLIFNNEIRSSIIGDFAYCAIYTEDVNYLKVWQNKITGFSYGMQNFNMNRSLVLENTITDSRVTGIHNEIISESDFACNTIDMDLQYRGNPGMFGIYCYQIDERSLIRTNCIFDCSASIYLTGGFGGRLPFIRNNYLYNYEPYGVFVDDYTGDIGSSPAFPDAGRNTFTSNSTFPGMTTDIFSNTFPIVEWGNYGVITVNALVGSGAPNDYNSTASCGRQITNPKNTYMDEIAICENVELGQFFAKGVLQSNPKELLQQIPVQQRFLEVLYTMNRLSAAGQSAELDAFYQAVSGSGLLNRHNDMAWTSYYYQALKKNWSAALSNLQAVQPLSADEQDMKYLETLRSQLAIDELNCKMLDTDTRNTLAAIDLRRGRNASVARDMLQLNDGYHDYIFREPMRTDLSKHHTPDIRSVSRLDEFLKVFPNPAEEQLTVQYFVENIKDVQLVIMDITGRELQGYQVIHNGAELKLQVKDLASGMYYISLKDLKKGHSLKGQFVKQ